MTTLLVLGALALSWAPSAPKARTDERAPAVRAALEALLPELRAVTGDRRVSVDLDLLEDPATRDSVAEAFGWPRVSRSATYACEERMPDGCVLVGTDALVRVEEVEVTPGGAHVLVRVETDGHGGRRAIRSRAWWVRLDRTDGAWTATEVRLLV